MVSVASFYTIFLVFRGHECLRQHVHLIGGKSKYTEAQCLKHRGSIQAIHLSYIFYTKKYNNVRP